MLRCLLTAALFLAIVSTAAAEDQGTRVSGGIEYSMSANDNGWVLRSLSPVVRTTGFGAGTEYVRGIETIYLGKSCDAFHKVFGSGTWGWANGGFVVQFGNNRFPFGRQEVFGAPQACLL